MQYGGEDLSEISINDVGDMNNVCLSFFYTCSFSHL